MHTHAGKPADDCPCRTENPRSCGHHADRFWDCGLTEFATHDDACGYDPVFGSRLPDDTPPRQHPSFLCHHCGVKYASPDMAAICFAFHQMPPAGRWNL